MKILIVYDTLHGNTEKIAQAVQEGMSSNHEVRLVKAAEARANEISGIDLIVVGSPTHGGWFTEPTKNFISALPDQGLQNIQAAAFDTGSSKEGERGMVRFIINLFGYASPRIANALHKKGANIIASETFFVLNMEGPLKEGEIERAKEWAARMATAAFP